MGIHSNRRMAEGLLAASEHTAYGNAARAITYRGFLEQCIPFRKWMEQSEASLKIFGVITEIV